MKTNVATFSTSTPGRICIARVVPRSIDIPHLRILAPSRELLRAHKHAEIDWTEYTRAYWTEIAARCKSNPAIWPAAQRAVETGRVADIRQGCLLFIVTSAAGKLGLDEITLCCYERSEDEHCHRKLVFDALPTDVRGLRL